MRPDTLKHLEDIRDAASFILESVEGKTFKHYCSDRLLRQAVERNFEIAGEALGRIKRSDPDMAQRLGDISRIIAFRNILAHGYDVVDSEIVWLVTKNNLPALLIAVKELMGISR